MTIVTIRNVSPGTRGIFQDDGSYVELDKGQSAKVELTAADRKLADKSGYWEFGESSAPADEGGEAATDDLKGLKKAELVELAGKEGVPIETDDNVADLKRKITEARTAKTAGAGGGIPPIVAPTDELDKMSDADLTNTVAALTGKPAAELPTDRTELLKLARGE